MNNMDHLTMIVYVAYAVVTGLATAAMMRKLLKISEDIQELRRIVLRTFESKNDANDDLMTRLERLQSMRFSYMGKTPDKVKGDK